MSVSVNIKAKDRFSFKDSGILMPVEDLTNGLWARTEVIGGYGDFIINPTGKSSLGEQCFNTHNIVPIGGVSYVMEKVFGVREQQIEVPTMYEQSGIGNPNSLAPKETYLTPDGEVNVLYRYGHFAQIYGIGITGTAENDVTVYHPDYRENGIRMSKVNADGLTVTGTMIPFRYTAEMLNSKERKQYFGKKTDENGMTGYYYKRFETTAMIKHVWKTGEDIEHSETEEDPEEQLVSSADVWENKYGLNTVESFTEFFLKISKKDVKEWFIALEQPDRARINTIALFAGEYTKDANNPADYGDYRDCKLFSKLCINPEYLSMSKDLNIIYRVYGH